MAYLSFSSIWLEAQYISHAIEILLPGGLMCKPFELSIDLEDILIFHYFSTGNTNTIDDVHSKIMVTLAIWWQSRICLENILSTLTSLKVNTFLEKELTFPNSWFPFAVLAGKSRLFHHPPLKKTLHG